MATYQSIRELTRGLQQGAKLLNDMFLKRKTVAIRYDDALATLDGDENKLRHLIHFGVIVAMGDTLELGEVYQRFFEEVLAVNEDINVASVQTYIGKLKLGIDSWLAVDSGIRKAQFAREIRHTFKSIEHVTQRNVVDLKRNVDTTYKQEPDFKVKKLRLNAFDEKARLIIELIKQTETVMDGQPIFFANATDTALRQTIAEVRAALHEAAHGLIALQAQITDYLNRIDYQSQLVRKVRQLKYLRDQYIIEASTDVKQVMAHTHDVWMERQPRYMTRVSVDYLRNDDSALELLAKVRSRLTTQATMRSRLAAPIDERYLQPQQETSQMFNHQEIMRGFLAQSSHLFDYVWHYPFESETDEEKRLVLFLQLSSQFHSDLRFTATTSVINNIEFPIIYPR
ncbi:MAG: hypothetical protein IKR25_06040 [Muribaculaceae bacterium]|nr:hypothetical protein [Muribaculaceae bacterium]